MKIKIILLIIITLFLGGCYNQKDVGEKYIEGLCKGMYFDGADIEYIDGGKYKKDVYNFKCYDIQLTGTINVEF